MMRLRLFLIVVLLTSTAHAASQQAPTTPTAESVLNELKTGNQHHAAHRYTHPHQTSARQQELTQGQHPHAVILSCSDSRVPPEVVFDQGLGDLFVVRVAGNVAGDHELASIEYAVEHLHCPLVVVLGHQNCGAVTAATEGGHAPGHLPTLLKEIQPAVVKAKSMQGNLIDNAVRTNVDGAVDRVRASSVLKDPLTKGDLRIVGAVYSLETGRVTWDASASPAASAPH
jgi:carbonic anhydrase